SSLGENFIYIDQRGTGCSDPYPSGVNEETMRRLTHYTSRSIVKDAEAIRVKLLGENGKWRVFGQSYGGSIVHRYIQVAPEHLDAAYSHGFALIDDIHQRYLQRLRSQLRVSKEYFRKYPQDESLIRKIRQAIAQDNCFTDGRLRICGPNVIDAA